MNIYKVEPQNFQTSPKFQKGLKLGVFGKQKVIWKGLQFACFDIYVETNQPTNSDTDFKMVRIQTIKI